VLVYGPGVKGNMAELLRFARAPYPLPVGALQSRRSLLSLDNLVAAIDTVLATPAPLRRPLIVSDLGAPTIPEMVAAVRRGLNRRPGLIPVPPALLETVARMAGRADGHVPAAGRLAGGGPRRAATPGLETAGRHRGRPRWAGARLKPARENRFG